PPSVAQCTPRPIASSSCRQGQSAGAPPLSHARPQKVLRPSACACWASSVASRVLPMPGSPASAKRQPAPAPACLRPPSSASSSRCRPLRPSTTRNSGASHRNNSFQKNARPGGAGQTHKEPHMNLKNAVLMMVAVVPLVAHAEARSAEASAALADAQKTLGVVPAMVRDMPDENVAPFWEQLKSLQMNPNTALNGKSKELIGLGVAAQVPCRYCVYGHTEFAKVNGASERELREAVATAGLARELSALANGPEAKKTDEKLSPELIATHEEIAKAFGGTEPDSLKRYPSVALVSLWKQMKAVTMNASGALPIKLKALISLAVVTQLPSTQCVKDYTA